MPNIKECLTLGIPSPLCDAELYRGARALLKEAGMPINDNTVYFDGFTNGLKKPTEDRTVNALNIQQLSGIRVLQSVAAREIDLGIVPPGMENSIDPVVFEVAMLDLPKVLTPDRSSTTRALLISSEPIPQSVITAEKLQGIEGLRNRLVWKLLKASEKAAERAEEYRTWRALLEANPGLGIFGGHGSFD